MNFHIIVLNMDSIVSVLNHVNLSIVFTSIIFEILKVSITSITFHSILQLFIVL